MATATGCVAVVTGAGRGFGRATTVAWSRDAVAELHMQLGDSFGPIVADAFHAGPDSVWVIP